MNSDKERNLLANQSATRAETLFTIVIGGNIISRGVTFENLLSMFFTRGKYSVESPLPPSTPLNSFSVPWGNVKDCNKCYTVTSTRIPESCV